MLHHKITLSCLCGFVVLTVALGSGCKIFSPQAKETKPRSSKLYGLEDDKYQLLIGPVHQNPEVFAFYVCKRSAGSSFVAANQSNVMNHNSPCVNAFRDEKKQPVLFFKQALKAGDDFTFTAWQKSLEKVSQQGSSKLETAKKSYTDTMSERNQFAVGAAMVASVMVLILGTVKMSAHAQWAALMSGSLAVAGIVFRKENTQKAYEDFLSIRDSIAQCRKVLYELTNDAQVLSTGCDVLFIKLPPLDPLTDIHTEDYLALLNQEKSVPAKKSIPTIVAQLGAVFHRTKGNNASAKVVYTCLPVIDKESLFDSCKGVNPKKYSQR